MDPKSSARPVTVELSAKDLLTLHAGLMSEIALMQGDELYVGRGNGTVHPNLFDLARRLESATNMAGDVPPEQMAKICTFRAELERENLETIKELTAKGQSVDQIGEDWV